MPVPGSLSGRTSAVLPFHRARSADRMSARPAYEPATLAALSHGTIRLQLSDSRAKSSLLLRIRPDYASTDRPLSPDGRVSFGWLRLTFTGPMQSQAGGRSAPEAATDPTGLRQSATLVSQPNVHCLFSKTQCECSLVLLSRHVEKTVFGLVDT